MSRDWVSVSLSAIPSRFFSRKPTIPMQKTRSRSSESHETGLVQELSSVDVATNLGLIQLLPFHPHDFFYQVGQNTKSLPVFFKLRWWCRLERLIDMFTFWQQAAVISEESQTILKIEVRENSITSHVTCRNFVQHSNAETWPWQVVVATRHDRTATHVRTGNWWCWAAKPACEIPQLGKVGTSPDQLRSLQSDAVAMPLEKKFASDDHCIVSRAQS